MKKTAVSLRQRYIVGRTLLALITDMRAYLPPRVERAHTGDFALLLVYWCVLIGHIDGRPMNASKVAHYLDLPRTTVLRKLSDLVRLAIVERKGSAYVLSGSLSNHAAEYTVHAMDLIRRASDELLRSA